MKKKITCCFLAAMCLCMGGCNSDIPEMKENETELITEYATHLLVKYGDNSDTGLLNDMRLESEMAREEIMRERTRNMLAARNNLLNGQKQDESASTSEESSQNETLAETTIAEPAIESMDSFFELSDISISYTTAELCDTYPKDEREDDILSISASQGKKLLVVSFLATNTSEQDVELDLFSKEGHYYASVNGNSKVEAYTTLLLDDLSTYYGNIESGETEELVLLFEVEEQEQIDTLELDVRQGEKKGTLVLQ